MQGPVGLAQCYTYGTLTTGAAGNSVTMTEYWADSSGHAKQVAPPGHTSAIDARCGTATVYSGIRPVRQPPTTFAAQKYLGLSPQAGDNLM